MEVEKVNICTGCLAVDRRMIHIFDGLRKRCFLQMITELSLPAPDSPLWLCWECEARIKRFSHFKLQVQNSYQVLHNIIQDLPVTIDAEMPQKQLTKYSINQAETSQFIPKLSTQDITNISILEHDQTIKSEVQETQENLQKQIKYESDSDDNLADTKLNTDVKERVKTKVKRAKTVKEKKRIYKEVDLSEEEVQEERRNLELREDYVNAMFRCEKCLISFPNEDDMKEHSYKKHELHASKHKCSICERSFNTEVAYNYHRSRHYRRYECFICSYVCTSKLAVRNHCAAVHIHSAGVKKLLKNCGLVENDVNRKSQKFPCEHCPKVFRWKTSLRKHAETHKIEAGIKRKPYCEPCRLSFTTTANLQKHVKTSSKHQIQLKLRKLKETTDASNDEQIADIKSSVNSTREVYPCAQCDKKFQWRGNLMRHMKSHAARAKGELVCAPCNRTFSSIATYKQHMKISKKHATEHDFKYMCSDCGMKFASKTKLKDHVDWEHLKNYVHTCPDCQKVFKTHTSLYLHGQVVHKKASAQHLCENCGKSFPNQTKLRSHRLAIHSREAAHRCGECGARFSWRSCLSRHTRRVHKL